MNAYALAGAFVALVMYIPLTVLVWRKKLTQNFATYFLWGLLDAVAAGSLWMQKGNFLLPAVYTIACSIVLVAILRTRTFAWSWRETATSLFVVASIAVWFCVDSKTATIVSTIGCVAAGLPQLYDIWKDPRSAPIFTYAGFTVANGLSVLAGRDWSIQERFYSTTSTALTLIFILVSARKWLPQFREATAT